jgi:hypothetical protein
MIKGQLLSFISSRHVPVPVASRLAQTALTTSSQMRGEADPFHWQRLMKAVAAILSSPKASLKTICQASVNQ